MNQRVLKSSCKHWLWASERENRAHKIAVAIRAHGCCNYVQDVYDIIYHTKQSLQNLKSWNCSFSNAQGDVQGYAAIKIAQSLMENRMDAVVLFGFSSLLTRLATLMPAVEIHHYLCDGSTAVSSENKTG